MVRLAIAALFAATTLTPVAATAGSYAEGDALGLEDAPLRLTAPADGTVLVPGRSVAIAWEPTAAWPDPAPELGRRGVPESAFTTVDGERVPVEEWEAFLSVNGGRTYPYRVTPHLDADVATFHFPVPDVASSDVRILIRMGNERREVGFEMPQRFSIAPAGPLLLLRRAAHEARYVVAERPGGKRPLDERATGEQGESARPGERGVRMWVEGDRRGLDLRTVEAARAPSMHGRSIEAGDFRLLAFLAPRHHALGATRDDSPGRRVSAAPSADTPPAAVARAASILLLIQRSNR